MYSRTIGAIDIL